MKNNYRKENVVDGVLCKRSNKCLFYNTFIHTIQSATKNNQLKRFSSISLTELRSLSKDNNTEDEYDVAGRLLGMCKIMGIKLDGMCSIMYGVLVKEREDWLANEDELCEYLEFENGLFEKCTEQVDEWFSKQDNETSHMDKQFKKYFETDSFVDACFNHFGYISGYTNICLENYMGLKMQMARTLAVLKTWNPDRDYTFEEVQSMTCIYSLVAGLTDVVDILNYEVGYLVGDEIDEFEYKEAMFNPTNMNVNIRSKKKEEKIRTNIAPIIKEEKIDEAAYLDEISKLRKKLQEKEQENKSLREQYKSAKEAADESEVLIKKYENERDELIALREYVYNSRQEDEEVSEDKLPEMKAAIAEKKIVIIGGHISWQNKMKKLFPKWLFVHPDDYKTVNIGMLEGKEKVFFYTDYINHISYKKFIGIVREKKIPFGYLGSKNVEYVIAQIYEEICE